ncbi:MAG: hypothetical protein HYV07_05020 [Deltaproteobacteria bacterium]|nr:hypothetical protein [Deltaproteobacteria bacterium]
MRTLTIVLPLALHACVLDYDALRGGGDASIAGDASSVDSSPIDSGTFVDAGRDGSVPDDGPSSDATRPDAGGDELDWPEVLDPCPTSWDVTGDESFEGDLAGWVQPPQGSFVAGHEWHTETGGLVVDMDGDANYWARHLLRRGFSGLDYAVMVDLIPLDSESWPQIHLRVAPTHPTEHFYGIRLNSDRNDLQLAVQTIADNASNPEVNSAFVPSALGEVRRLVAWVKNDGADVLVRAALYDLGDNFVSGSLIEHRYSGATAYTSPGGFGLSGWVGLTRFEHVRFFECR